jgi:hypothetical protein
MITFLSTFHHDVPAAADSAAVNIASDAVFAAAMSTLNHAAGKGPAWKADFADTAGHSSNRELVHLESLLTHVCATPGLHDFMRLLRRLR